jgi:3-oxoadipate enol-lactonase
MATVDINGVDTYYEDFGEGSPIVVLHGATADHQVWAEQLQPLTDEYRVILYDLRGHGKTGATDRDQYTVDTYADDLAAFITAMDLEAPIILGHSLGGIVGYAFADEYPERLSALITVGSATPQMFSLQERLMKGGLMRLSSLIVGSDRLMNAITWLQVKLTDDDSTVDLDDHQRIRDAHNCDDTDIEASERAKVTDAMRTYFDSTRSLQLSETPTLVLYGEHEPMIEPHAAYLERQSGSCQAIEIPEASHNAQVERPEFIRTQIREFVSTR